MESAIAVRSEINMSEWSTMKEKAGVLVKSGFCPPALNTAEKVIAVMLTAKELNIGSMEAIRSINIIQGKPAMAVQLMLALCQRTKEVESFGIKEDEKGAHVTMKRKGQEPYTAHFGPVQAKALQLDTKDNYKKQATTMYKWRAIAEACRFVFPDAVCGLYTPEELGANVVVTPDGDMVVTPDPAPAITEPQRATATQGDDHPSESNPTPSGDESTDDSQMPGADWKLMFARKTGPCSDCGETISVGQEMYWKPTEKKGVHKIHYQTNG